MNQQFLTELKAVTAENRIFTDEPMKKHTTFRVGGPADILVQPKGTELAAVIRLCRKYDVPYQVIGNGSNLLVGDRGIRGLVSEMLSKEDQICVEDDCITVGAGMLLSKTANRATEHGLTGMEFAAGIPGSIGGAVVMNAKGKVSWTHASIGRILENPSYLGTEYYPQLIGEELFERVQRRREKVRAELGRADHRPGRDERILFGGVIWCAECGAVCSHIQPNHKKERGGTAKWKCKSYVTGRAKNCRNSFITDGQAKQMCVEAINAVIRNKGLLRVQRQEEKLSPQYRVLERNLQHMKEEQERTETDLMKLLYERAEERYRTLEVRDGEFRTEEIKNILAGKKELETFDENLYRKIIARIWVHGGNMAEVELINGSRVTAGYKD